MKKINPKNIYKKLGNLVESNKKGYVDGEKKFVLSNDKEYHFVELIEQFPKDNNYNLC